jgi:hypothetical protein
MGVVLFEMLAGRPPFDEEQPMATAIAQRDAPVPDLRAIRPDLPDILVAIVERALQKDPADRFESAAAMRTALTAPLWPAPPAAGATVAVVPPAEDRTAVMRRSGHLCSGDGRGSGGRRGRDAVRLRAGARRRVCRAAVPQRASRSGATRTIAIVLVVIALGALVLALALRGGDDGDPARRGDRAGRGTVAGGGAVDPRAGTAVTPPALRRRSSCLRTSPS